MPTIKKTALLLDVDLVAQCRELLGTKTTTETILEAMREVIRVEGRAQGLERLRRRAADLNDPEIMAGAWRTGGRPLGQTYGAGRGDVPG